MILKDTSRSWAVVAGLISISIAANSYGQTPKMTPVTQNRRPITMQSVLRAAAQFLHTDVGEHPTEEVNLRWFEPPVAEEENPQLEVSGMYPDLRRSTANLHLRCVRRHVCGDFWVALEVPPEVIKQWRCDRRKTTEGGLGSLLFYHDREQSENSDSVGPTLIRAGQRATVAIEEPGMQITLLVRCLEGGRLKQVIRVYDPNSHRVFHAEVAGVDQLRARWQ